MYERLTETILKNRNNIRRGGYIDAYNKTIRTDGLIACIHANVGTRNMDFVIVENDDNKSAIKKRICD